MTPAQGLNTNLLLPKDYIPAFPKQARQGMTIWYPQAGVLHDQRPPGGALAFELSRARAVFRRGQKVLEQDIDKLKTLYGFRATETVALFLMNRPTILSLLIAAVPHLKEHFGDENIFNLEVSVEDDDSQTIYAVVVWHSTVQAAAQALEAFLESWWLDRMTYNTADIAFTYELA